MTGPTDQRSQPPVCDAETRPSIIPTHGRGKLRPFQPGQSGNPTGASTRFHEVRQLMRDASPAAAKRLIDLINSTDERVALVAAEKVLERAWGSPKQDTSAPELDPEKQARADEAKKVVRDLLERMAHGEIPAAASGDDLPSAQVAGSPARRDPQSPLPVDRTVPPPPRSWPP